MNLDIERKLLKDLISTFAKDDWEIVADLIVRMKPATNIEDITVLGAIDIAKSWTGSEKCKCCSLAISTKLLK